jgi:hypothetical protein
MEKCHIENLISHEVKQMEESMNAIIGVSDLINAETVKKNYDFAYEALNRLRKINIELTETLIFWSNSEGKY